MGDGAALEVSEGMPSPGLCGHPCQYTMARLLPFTLEPASSVWVPVPMPEKGRECCTFVVRGVSSRTGLDVWSCSGTGEEIPARERRSFICSAEGSLDHRITGY